MVHWPETMVTYDLTDKILLDGIKENPDSRYHMIEGAEHCFTKVEYRERLNELVREFLNK